MEGKRTFCMSGYVGIAGLLVILITRIDLFIYRASHANGVLVVLGTILLVEVILSSSSLTTISPNRTRAVLFFGRYLGTIKKGGLFITIPFTQRMNTSLEVRDFNSSLLRVNGSDGSPIEVSAVIVFRVVGTTKALFNVDYYQDFVEIQSKTAIRYIATQYPCDTLSDNNVALQRNTEQIPEELTKGLQEHLAVAGVEVIKAQLNRLAYTTEIASSML